MSQFQFKLMFGPYFQNIKCKCMINIGQSLLPSLGDSHNSKKKLHTGGP